MTIKFYYYINIIFLLAKFINGNLIIQDEIIEETQNLYTIEGKVYPPDILYTTINYHIHDPDKASSPSPSPSPLPSSSSATISNNTGNRWQIDTTVTINGDEYKGFLHEDGTFIISGVPSGSYVVEVNNPDYLYEPVRVEINPKGKFRARRVNYLQPAQVIQVPYPLKMRVWYKYKYFQKREQWKITDFLFSPMVLMMVLPVFLLCILPKMINDPETKKELENIQFPKINNDMPEISEMFTSLFAGGSKSLSDKKSLNANKQIKKRN